MSKINELKVKYYLTKGPRYESMYKNPEPFFIKYPLEPNQTNINLILIKKIIGLELNTYNIVEFRYYNPIKKGYIKITNRTSFPIQSNEIELQIQLKEPEPKELTELIKMSKILELKLKEYEEIKNKMEELVKKVKIDLFFLYAFPLEESQDTEYNSIIAYHLEIAKIDEIFKKSKKGFNAIFESASVQKLKDAIREEPKVIHISCHGLDPKDGYALVFEEKGKKKIVTEKDLDEILFKLKDKLVNIDLVVLSSCYSEVAGELFLKYGVKNVIYIDKYFPISNTASLRFANSFYQKLVDLSEVEKAFDSTKSELYEKETIRNNKDLKCCCFVHKNHLKSCCLKDSTLRETIHNEFHIKSCKCNFEEFWKHKNSCEIIKNAKKRDYKKFFFIEKIDSDTSSICCGCDKDRKDLHHSGESFKFKYVKKNKESGNIIIYNDNVKGKKYKKNKNCFIVKDTETYKDNFLLLIGRRDKVKEIYDIIEDKNEKKPFIVIYGDAGVGKFNFANSVCIYLFERNVINYYYSKKRVRTIEEIRGLIGSVDSKYEDEKYVFIIEIDIELLSPLNFVDDIINEDSILDPKFYFFILLRTTRDKIDLKQKQEKSKLIHLEHLTNEKALQLLIELKDVYNFKKDYLTINQKKDLINIIKNSRKEMYPLLQLIEHYDKYEDVKKEIEEKVNQKKSTDSEKRRIMESNAGKIIFLLTVMNKGLPSSVLELFEPEFENIKKDNIARNFFYPSNHCNCWRIMKPKINMDDIKLLLQPDKMEEWIENCIEIFAKILVHFNLQKIKKNQRYFGCLNIEYFCNIFFENNGFWKTFNNDIYQECFMNDKHFDEYENIIKCDLIKLEDIKDNLFNLFEVNSEIINDIYSKNETMKEFLEQIIFLLPNLFIKNTIELKIILVKFENFVKKLKNFDKKNLLKNKLFSLCLYDNHELNFADLDELDKEARAYAYFIKGIRINDNKLKYPNQHTINKSKKNNFNGILKKQKDSFEEAKKYFINNTMKAYCYYQIGNLEYEQKHYKLAETCFEEGKKLPGIGQFIKGLLNLRLAKLIIDNIPNKIDNKPKFNTIIKDLKDSEDGWFRIQAEELQKEIEKKLLPDIVLLSSNPFIKGKCLSTNTKIQAGFNNQYYLMDKINNRDDINTSLIIKYKVLNEDNLREAFSGKGKILIIQSDDFNKEGDILLESNIGESYSYSINNFNKIIKINYDVLILCFVNSSKSIEILKNKVKYLITFNEICDFIIEDLGDQSILEYNKLSIDFLEHFIVNITKENVQKAYERSYDTFKASFKNFCKQKTNIKKLEKTEFINLTMNNQGRIKNNEYLLIEKGKGNIQFIPYPLLTLFKISLKFSYNSDYYCEIYQIVKTIMDKLEKYYFDSSDSKKKIIEINLFGQDDKDIYISSNICLKTKQLISLEVMRFLFRHHEIFNSLLFNYYSKIDKYIRNTNKLQKMREENSSGLGLIIIDMKQNNKQKNKFHKKIPGFLYIYLSNDTMSNGVNNILIINKIKSNEINTTPLKESTKKKKERKNKRYKTNYQKNKTKNWDGRENNSKSNTNLTGKKNSVSNFNLTEQKLKYYEDKRLDFLVYDLEQSEEEDDYLSQDD